MVNHQLAVCLLIAMLITSCTKGQGEVGLEGSDTQRMIDSDSIRSSLSSFQREVMCGGATEAPFTGAYLYNKDEGVYHCAACNHPLFDSDTKYDSGSGWPSFYDQIAEGAVTTKTDNSHGMIRTEILCGQCGGHLGHIFNDGPRNKTGQRYCVNSVSLSFEPTKSILDIPEFE
ncbi:MAG: peptide-methionine (R)-S-oxide reductase MsrB [Bacteroidota bacterium]|nr:peptide-methionine (R)-S-oxide reductase MsrB [Bacteroidota bacterium]MEC8032301.1 peptide-methionine (R)-S-oxide reductase MsrB [Bacteroidota bacterium]MEC8835233.1 peptide-methionine (R)-S-oxide reductase MsrB [Bacteroidota bacterium]MEC9222145.1 peptide-methionine (R)-S-oxide reductase MsrB [Bacteroidota bacterium]|tara:strand:+ start:857 stop:1375 length:519 start_codon:yes stop_codon:yes gene_type:complete